MAEIKLTNLATCRTYFQSVATAHVDIEGYKWGDAKVIRNDNRSDIEANFLWAMPYEGAKYSGPDDNVQKIKAARIAYMMVADSEKFSDEDAALDFCEGIIEDIVSKILLDKRGAEVAGEWSLIITKIASMSSGPVQKVFGATKYIGYELRLDFQDPAGMVYNPDKWA